MVKHLIATTLILGCVAILPNGLAFAQGSINYAAIEQQIDSGTYSEAETLLTKALENNPTDTRARVLLADVFDRSGRYANAATQYNILIEQNPGDVRYYYDKAAVSLHDGDYDSAFNILNQAKDANPDDFFATADEPLNALLRNTPDNQEARFLLARTYGMQNNPQAAFDEYQALIKQNTTNADYHLGKGLALVRMERYDDALEAFNRASELSPDYEDVYRAKIRTYQLQGNYDAAVSTTNDAISRFPDSTWQVPEQQTEQTKPDQVASNPDPDRPADRNNMDVPYLDVELGGGYDYLDNDFEDWNNQYMSFRTEIRKGLGFYGRLRGTRRFGFYDTEMQLGTFLPILPFLTYVGEGTYSPSGEVIPEYSFFNGLQLALPYGFVLSGGHRHSQYKLGIVETGVYGLEKYYKQFRVGYTMFQSYLHGADTRYAHLISGNYYYGIN
ncbi:MAG: tetratricopeptide repeat protein, partial [Cyanobacteria bacterium HKST-UBA06]|nr:tetratricopeptide repeat protein [Cyanobacteria bacterium HKST-UBA06]